MRAPTPAEFKRRFTCEEYLDLVEQLDGKYELHDGRLVDFRAMAGASSDHSLITMNVGRELGNKLKGTPCRVHSSDLTLRIPRTPTYRFGDVVVVCGPIEYDPSDKSKNRAVMNPRLIVEVASPSTQRDDNTRKFHAYETIATFEEYVLVQQDVPYVQTRHRQRDGSWKIAFCDDRNGHLRLASLGIDLSLAEVYDGAEFPDPEPTTGDSPTTGDDADAAAES